MMAMTTRSSMSVNPVEKSYARTANALSLFFNEVKLRVEARNILLRAREPGRECGWRSSWRPEGCKGDPECGNNSKYRYDKQHALGTLVVFGKMRVYNQTYQR